MVQRNQACSQRCSKPFFMGFLEISEYIGLRRAIKNIGIFVGTYSLFAMPDNNVRLLIIAVIQCHTGLACDWLVKAIFAKYAPKITEQLSRHCSFLLYNYSGIYSL